jgi:hypothetical protein
VKIYFVNLFLGCANLIYYLRLFKIYLKTQKKYSPLQPPPKGRLKKPVLSWRLLSPFLGGDLGEADL